MHVQMLIYIQILSKSVIVRTAYIFPRHIHRYVYLLPKFSNALMICLAAYQSTTSTGPKCEGRLKAQ